MTSGPLDTRALGTAARQASSLIVFGLLPVAVILWFQATAFGGRTFLYDFRGDLYGAGVAILHGHDPYRAAFLDHLAAVQRAGGQPSTSFAVPVYPAPALLAGVPLALLTVHLAGIIFTLLAVAAMVSGLWLLGVRDWRCYGVAFLSWPVAHSLRLGQVNEFLVLGAAVAWRWRDRVWPPAAGVAAVVLAKLLLWPLGVWLLLTRRWRAAALAVALAALVSTLAWAIIGFSGLGAYPRMLNDLSTVEGTAGVSLVSLGDAVGISRAASETVGWITAAGLLGIAWRLLGRPGGDHRAFSLSVVAALLASPLVWPHYMTLLFVPIALASPRLSPWWFVPLISYLAPVEVTHRDAWRILPYVAIEVLVIVAVWLAGRRRGSPSHRSQQPGGVPGTLAS